MVEPGSTFKIVVASAALNERVVNEKTLIYCENGALFLRGPDSARSPRLRSNDRPRHPDEILEYRLGQNGSDDG
jgi:cell division protein FtsI/penicillin-binding protein 2